MSFRTWFADLQVARTFDLLKRDWHRSPRRRHTSFSCLPAEVLEVRSLLSSYTAASVSALVADINAANASGGANTITLAANTKFDLTAVDNTTNGVNGLPVISGAKVADNLTIIGRGATIDRSTAAGTPAFRLLDVASGNSLTLQNVTLQNGLAQGSGMAADGGAVLNQGALTLSGVTVQNNVAIGADGKNFAFGPNGSTLAAATDAAGGGVWSSGVLTLQDLSLSGGGLIHTLLQNNTARGGNGGIYFNGKYTGTNGGNALGGALYVAGGTANLANANLANNTARGGGGDEYLLKVNVVQFGSIGGAAFGGAVDIAGGRVAMTGLVVKSNQAQGGTGGQGQMVPIQWNNPLERGGTASGGGINVAGGTVTLATVDLLSNTAVGGQGGPGTGDSGGAPGGDAFGGGLCVGGGVVTLTKDSVTANQAAGGAPGYGFYGWGTPRYGLGYGGGIDIASAATVYLDSFTVANTTNNYASYSNSSVDGPYILRN
jgi:hypothetical protein